MTKVPLVRTRKLYYSDNLPVLRDIESESIDLIYLDPPFNSNRAYNIIYPNDLGQVRAFEDTWCWNTQCDEYMEELKNRGGGYREHTMYYMPLFPH